MVTTVDELTVQERKKIQDFLSRYPVAVLATVDEAGDPYASTIYIAVDDDLGIAFTTKQETNKFKNLAHNSHVALAVCDAESQTAVHIRGRAIEVTEHEAQHRIFSGILHAAEQTGEDVVPPVAKIAAGPYASFKIDISDIQLLEYGWGNNFLHALKHANDHQSSGDPL